MGDWRLQTPNRVVVGLTCSAGQVEVKMWPDLQSASVKEITFGGKITRSCFMGDWRLQTPNRVVVGSTCSAGQVEAKCDQICNLSS